MKYVLHCWYADDSDSGGEVSGRLFNEAEKEAVELVINMIQPMKQWEFVPVQPELSPEEMK